MPHIRGTGRHNPTGAMKNLPIFSFFLHESAGQIRQALSTLANRGRCSRPKETNVANDNQTQIGEQTACDEGSRLASARCIGSPGERAGRPR